MVNASDHVALAQPWKYFDEAVLSYRSVLGLTPYRTLDVADPHGLIRSRAMASTGGAVRLALNVAASVVTLFYSVLLIRLNTTELPAAIRVRGVRLGGMIVAVCFYGFFAVATLVTQIQANL